MKVIIVVDIMVYYIQAGYLALPGVDTDPWKKDDMILFLNQIKVMYFG